MGTHAEKIRRITDRLYPESTRRYLAPMPSEEALAGSVVAFLLRPCAADDGVELVLTRRSQQVRQPGDLCCPGGGTEPALDRAIGRLLMLPGSPLTRWPLWRRWQAAAGACGRLLPELLATALRECVEEIRLVPFGVRFLGMLPPQELVLFRRAIYPVVCWVPRQRRFFPNWEVDAMVSIPVAELLDPHRYVCYRLRFEEGVRHPTTGTAVKEFIGFRYTDTLDSAGVFWGATFRMAMDYLKIVHGFTPPAPDGLPVVDRAIGTDYLTGNGFRGNGKGEWDAEKRR